MAGARSKKYQQGMQSGSAGTGRKGRGGDQDGRRNRGLEEQRQHTEDKQMVTDIINLLCGFGGQARVCELEKHLQPQRQQQQQQQHPSLVAVMSRRPHLFTLSDQDGEVLAKVHTDLKLCGKYCTDAGCKSTACDALHLCKFFLVSSCSAEKKEMQCRYGHDFGTGHNLRLLERHGLKGLQPKHLQLIFKLNRSPATLPMTCKFYNSKAGCNKASGKGCPGMHVCLPFLQKRCKFGEECRSSHNVLDFQPKNILIHYGFNVERDMDVILDELRGQQQNYALSKQTSQHVSSEAPASPNSNVKPPKITATRGESVDDGTLVICMFFLRGKCHYGDNCRNKHSKRHFQWQREQSNKSQVTWVDFDAKENLELELNFSDPNKEECVLEDSLRGLKVDFVKMEFCRDSAPAIKVRRLGTISSVLAPPTHKGTTRWLWFWRDDAQKWIEYGNPDTKEGFTAGISSADLEETFNQNNSDKVQFQTSGHKYELDFATMTQVNFSVGTKRPVHRRPAFDKETDYTTKSSPKARRRSSDTIPRNWDFTNVSDNDDFHAVPVFKSGSTLAEYNKIETLFHQTMPGKPIKSIKRIQNIDLWEEFERKKNKMTRKLKSCGTLDERLLFHGTNKKCKDAICQQGFDWRYSGTATGAIYGNGSYFARDAKYSSSYTDDSTMFVVRVLVGEFAKGSSGERLPSLKDPKMPFAERYDSSVDNPSDPSIFVIYERDQSYPEYLIEY